jgi:hypothetical protein
MARHKTEEGEWRSSPGMPSLHDLVPNKPCGAVLPLSERARSQIQDRIEVIEYLLNQERVVWT